MAKITLNDIKNDNKKYSEKQKIMLSDGKYVFIYPHFSPSKMGELIQEMFTDAIRAKDAGIDFESINKNDWALFNIIYKFADLGIPSEIKKKVQAFHLLIDWDHFGTIIESFPQESLDKFSNHMVNVAENVDKLLKNKQLTTQEIEEFVSEEITDIKEND